LANGPSFARIFLVVQIADWDYDLLPIEFAALKEAVESPPDLATIPRWFRKYYSTFVIDNES
jgi:hypothetical protein